MQRKRGGVMKLTNVKAKTAVLGMAVMLLCAGTPEMRANDAILDLLVKKGVINQREANEIREQADAENAKTIEQFNKIKTPSWLDMLTLSGDFRLRTEYFNFENDDLTGKNTSLDRLRFRYRLRLGAEWKMQDWATVGVRLASGQQGNGDALSTNPTSANQTMTDTFSRKPIGIDLAYVALTPPAFDNIKIIGGKMVAPIWEPKMGSMLVWDPDVNPEGVGEQIDWKFGEKQQYRLFVNAGQFVLSEFSNDSNDAYLFDQEVGLEAKFNDHLKVTVAGGYFTTHGLDLVNTTKGKNDSSPNVGNATTSAGKYLGDFNIGYGRGELVYTINDKTFLGTPNVVTLGAEYLKNMSSAYDTLRGASTSIDPHQTEAWTAQIAFGDNKKRGQWKVSYQYKVVGADSTLDLQTDDDFGSGGTDRRGHVVEASYNIRDWWSLRTIAFLTEKITDRPNSGHNALGFGGQEFARFQFDTMFKF